MNMNKHLSNLIQNFFYQRLINQRDSSQRTISTYRDTFRLLLGLSQEYLNKKIDKLQLIDLNADVDLTVVALWLGHEGITTTHHYVETDITMKEKALSKILDPKTKSVRFKPNAKLLAFLDAL
jgi:hypothetical protein